MNIAKHYDGSSLEFDGITVDITSDELGAIRNLLRNVRSAASLLALDHPNDESITSMTESIMHDVQNVCEVLDNLTD